MNGVAGMYEHGQNTVLNHGCRLNLASVMPAVGKRRPCQCSAAACSPAGASAPKRLTASLLGAAAGLSLLLPGNCMALEAGLTPPQQQVSRTGALLQKHTAVPTEEGFLPGISPDVA